MPPPRGVRPVDRSWRSLLEPGDADDYFDFELPPRLRLTGDFSVAAGQFLAELSRLTYQYQGSVRRLVVQRVGWQEVGFIERGETQCGLYRPLEPTAGEAMAVVFRGTDSLRNWLGNLDAKQDDWSAGGRVHRGFRQAFDMVWGEVRGRAAAYDGELVAAGHSLGGALAQLAASTGDAATAYSFGAPRVGDAEFAATLDRRPVHRVVNHVDIVPALPPEVGRNPYRHGGRTVQIGRGEEDVRTTPLELVRALTGKRVSEWTLAPRRLADHAPVNYVHQLATVEP